jgi:pimeloyl-ACP methyl ester carboxylesterase
MKHLKRGGRFLITMLLIVCVVFLALTWMASSRLICPRRDALEDYHRVILNHANDHGLTIHTFSVRTTDGYETPCLLCEPSKLPGAAHKGNKLRQELQANGLTPPLWGDMRATLVLLHGHNGRKENFLPVAERLCAAGFRCILVDLPAHGEHPARFSTFGVVEAKLPNEVLQEAARRFSFDPQPSGLFGISQGGAIALQAAARQNETWFAVAELSGFATLDEVIELQARQWFGPFQKPAHAVVSWLVAQRAGFDPKGVRPIDAAMQLRDRPVLIGHGERDSFIEYAHAHRLFAAVPGANKEFLPVPDAGHPDVLITSTPVYATVSAFFLKALPPAANSAKVGFPSK